MRANLAGVAIVLCCLFFLIFFYQRFSGQQAFLVIEPGTILVNRKEGRVQTVSFEIKNMGNSSVEVISVEKNCSCISAIALPITVAAQSSVEYTVEIDLNKTSDSVQELYFFFKTNPLGKRPFAKIQLE